MEVKHRELLASSSKHLAGVLELSDQFKCLLLIRKLFTAPMLDDIFSKDSDWAKKEELVLELRTRGPFAFQKFLNILKDTGQKESIDVLEGKPFPSKRGQERRKHSENQGPMQLFVRTAQKVQRGKKIFKMTSKPRGKCLIINNIDFDGIMSYRTGSEKDGMKLDMVFNQLHYDVKLKCDVTADAMKELFEKFAKDPEHECLDSCVVIILSHGDSDIIYGVDGEKVRVEDIFAMFNNENCPVLMTKPKMFFIQACRGSDNDSGVEAKETTDAGVVRTQTPTKSRFRIPVYTDMLIAYSTIPGYASIRDEIFGTWFCQELVDALIEDACDTDVETILKRVDEKVQARVSASGDKQSTEVIRRGWHKTLYFNPGLYDPMK